jgi:outer membrane protein OmpA-like peptidoglycan-associated protein
MSMHQFGKILLLHSILILVPFLLDAQEQDKEQSVQYYELAKEMISSTRAVDDARDLMVIAADYDTTNLQANFEAGYMYVTTINKELAEKYFNRVYRQKPDYRFDLEYWIGQSYHYGSKFDLALDFYNRYKNKLEKTSTNYSGKNKIPLKQVDRRIEECNYGKKYVADPKSFSIVNLGPEINSEYDDYAPVVNSDETEMIFTTRRRDGNINENVWDDNKPYEDIFVSKKSGSKWGQASNIGTTLNSKYNNSNLTLSPSGKILFIYKDGIGEGDIFYSERQPDGNWSTAKPLPGTINSPYRESSASITEDESTIFFSSERPGGLGGSDIYMAKKNSKGLWSVIKNMGPSVNTEYDEDGPYVEYDGKTLYFSSMGLKGMGGYDIYEIQLLDPDQNQWSEPENVGYPINTPDDDIFITGTSTPNRFYYASARADGLGYSDIYLITTEEVKKDSVVAKEPPKKESYIQKYVVNILDAETKTLLNANVRIRGMDNTSVASVNISEGVYQFVVMSPVKKDYLIYVEKEGYIFENFGVTLGGVIENESDETKTVYLRKVKTGEISVMRHVFFETGKATLTEESFDELDKLILMLKQNPAMKVEIGGHTDDVGTHEYNMKLSQQRAGSVRSYLLKNGVENKRVASVGYGETRPIVSNDDEIGGREINRRVEFKITEN